MRSNDVFSDVLLYTECNCWFLWDWFFNVDVVFSMLMMYSLSILDKSFSAGCQAVTIIGFSLCCCQGFFFVVGVRHGFLLTCLLRAFSVWSFRNPVLWKGLNIHYFSGIIRCTGGDRAIVTLGRFWSHVQGDKILG